MDVLTTALLAVFVISAMLVGHAMGTKKVFQARDKGLLAILVVTTVVLALKLVFGGWVIYWI